MLILAVWAAVTWVYREKLLPIPAPSQTPPPHFRSDPPQVAARDAEAAPPPTTTETSDAPPTVAGDDLTEVKGIGPVYRQRLADIGITTFAELLDGDVADIAEHIEVTESHVHEWMDQARDLVG